MLFSMSDHSIDFLGSCFQTLLLLPCLYLSFQVNFLSYVALATAALPTLEKNRGALVVVSSLAGWWLYLELSAGLMGRVVPSTVHISLLYNS